MSYDTSGKVDCFIPGERDFRQINADSLHACCFMVLFIRVGLTLHFVKCELKYDSLILL